MAEVITRMGEIDLTIGAARQKTGFGAGGIGKVSFEIHLRDGGGVLGDEICMGGRCMRDLRSGGV